MPNHTPPQLFLIDGYALIYRAFFALISRPLRTSRGENTSAAWGVANFLLRLQTKYHPDYVIWVNDAGDSFRKERYPEYKSTREKLDAELQADFDQAVERIQQLLAAFRIPEATVRGYEADDVIGTLARQATAQSLHSVIVSGDKDFYQLIASSVSLLNPGRGGPAGVEEQWVTEQNAAERLGVGPAQVVDYLAIVGDASDNVPGIHGIGEKGAQALLGEYGDLETALARAGEVKAKRTREALQQYAAEARLSRELVTIRLDVPVSLDLDAAQIQEPDRQALLRVLTDLEFHTLAKRFVPSTIPPVGQPEGPGSVSGPLPIPTAGPAETGPAVASAIVITEPSTLVDVARQLRSAPFVVLHTESTGSEPHDAELIALTLAGGPSQVWYLSFGHRPPDGVLVAPDSVGNLPILSDPACRPIADLLRDPSVAKVGHNIKHDWQVLRRAGVEVGGFVSDVMLESFLLDPGRRSHGIDTLVLDHLGWTLPPRSEEAPGKGRRERPYAELTVSLAAAHASAFAAAVLLLHAKYRPELKQLHLESLLTEMEMPLVEVLVDMEWKGIAIDRALFERLARELNSDMLRLEAEIGRLAGTGVNLNSPKQLAVLLYEKLQLPMLKKTKTGPSTDADVLEQLADMGHDVPRVLLEYRELQKLRSTYVDVLPMRVNRTTNRIHTIFHQTGAATGRISSSEPNLQNIPVRSARGEEIRLGFVPAPGARFVVADYSQIELRLLAHLSEDPAFLAAFRQGEDIHRQTAALIFGVSLDDVTSEMRGRAKTINFGTIYGQGPFALSKQLGISLEEAKSFIAQYFQRFSGVRAYLDRQVELARAQGYVETLFKRRRYIPEIKDRNFNVRSFGERTAQNSPLQGSAADLIKLAMVRIHRALRAEALAAQLVLQVHDELIVETPELEVSKVTSLVKRHMEQAAELKVPLVVDVGVGSNWLAAKH